ncbi:MAG: hypothetical protein ACR2FM_05205 [Candidatus Saccharimonadales bacterium]
MSSNTSNNSEQLSQIVESLDKANNVLVTVSNSPSVDQLAACIGLTLALSKQGKHATAVFSGKIPSTLGFLQPENTIEKNTNSLRDFIISLDKSKADKLRYKVEDDFVKIFITPYRVSIDEKDLAFSEGDFNIDLIITLGVHERGHLDDAIIAHGRILHDATVVSLNTDSASDIGSISWVNTGASSLCEMTSDLVIKLDKELLDEQIATALLTGMVSETNRFGNEKAHPNTMAVSGILMAAGASPQLISGELHVDDPDNEPAQEIPEVVEEEEPAEPEPPRADDGMISIDHNPDDSKVEEDQPTPTPNPNPEPEPEPVEEPSEEPFEKPSEEPSEESSPFPESPEPSKVQREASRPYLSEGSKIMTEPPKNDAPFSAGGIPGQGEEPANYDPMMQAPSPTPLLERTQQSSQAAPADVTPPQADPSSEQTLADLEYAVGSLHVSHSDEPNKQSPAVETPPPMLLDDARSAVEHVVDSTDSYRPDPINALNAATLDLELGHDPVPTDSPAPTDTPPSSGTTPPPVPPPMIPPGV